MSATVIYFIQVGHDGPIKIGISDSPYRRLNSLQGAHHERLHLVGLTPAPGGRFEEARVHDALHEHALAREWYKPHPDVFAAIVEPLTNVAETLDLALRAKEHLRLAISGLRGWRDTDDADAHMRAARDLLIQAVRDEVAA